MESGGEAWWPLWLCGPRTMAKVSLVFPGLSSCWLLQVKACVRPALGCQGHLPVTLSLSIGMLHSFCSFPVGAEWPSQFGCKELF